MYTKEYDLSCIKDDENNNSLLNKKKWIMNNKTYEIYKYNKNILTLDNVYSVGVFRSIVCYNNRILSFSPPKSLNLDIFMTQYKEEDCIAEEFIEGTMINLFYDNDSNKWEIASKSTVGGNVKFNKEQPTFSELFYEISSKLNINFDLLSKNYCYSFVMQHPKNKFVIPIIEKRLYLISIYAIDNNNLKVREIPKNEYHNLVLPENVSYPFGYYFNSYDELKDMYGSMNTATNIMGIVIRNKNGDRTKIRNPNYEYVKNLKGNNTKLQFQYLSLRKLGQVNYYLTFFPDNRKEFLEFKNQLHLFTDNLFRNYINCYIKKVKPLKEYPFQFRNHMFNLHQYYLSVRENNGFVNKNVVINYINNLESAKLMYSLNYHLRDLTKLKNNINSEESNDHEMSDCTPAFLNSFIK
tara:strand:+ start:2750 stop:3976 length:1227 start_codon:yes stop_codon:yes gene_type:complete